MNKPLKTYTPLLSEILTKVNNAKTKDKKIAVLKDNDSEPLRMLIKSSFDPKIKWVMPEGNVPYKPNEAPEGTEHTLLSQEVRRFWHYIEGADNETPKTVLAPVDTMKPESSATPPDARLKSIPVTSN